MHPLSLSLSPSLSLSLSLFLSLTHTDTHTHTHTHTRTQAHTHTHTQILVVLVAGDQRITWHSSTLLVPVPVVVAICIQHQSEKLALLLQATYNTCNHCDFLCSSVTSISNSNTPLFLSCPYMFMLCAINVPGPTFSNATVDTLVLLLLVANEADSIGHLMILTWQMKLILLVT
jgi:hypothetical protein